MKIRTLECEGKRQNYTKVGNPYEDFTYYLVQRRRFLKWKTLARFRDLEKAKDYVILLQNEHEKKKPKNKVLFQYG